MAPSLEEISLWPSPEKSTGYKPSEGPEQHGNSLPVTESHKRIFPPTSHPAASVLPSGEKATVIRCLGSLVSHTALPVETSHSRSVRSHNPAASMVPSGERAGQLAICFLSHLRHEISAPFSVSQRRIDNLPKESKRLPSGKNVSFWALSVAHLQERSSLPLAVSHKWIGLSPPRAPAKILPSGEKARVAGPTAGHGCRQICLPVAVFHKLSPSSEAEARILPSGARAT